LGKPEQIILKILEFSSAPSQTVALDLSRSLTKSPTAHCSNISGRYFAKDILMMSFKKKFKRGLRKTTGLLWDAWQLDQQIPLQS